MTNDEIFDDIVSACREFQAAGYSLTKGEYVITDTGTADGKVCGGCALTAVLFVHLDGLPAIRGVGIEAERLARKRFGWIGTYDIGDFIDGFDNEGSRNRRQAVSDVFDLGARVRAAVLP